MKPTKTILVCILAAGFASAQSPSIIQNTRATMNGVSNNAAAATNQALSMSESPMSSTATTHPAVKSGSSGKAAVVIPAKSSAKGTSVAVTKSAAVSKHAHTVGAKHSPEQKAAVAAAGNPPANTAAVGPASTEGENAATEQQVTPDSKYAANGRRDPFISPVVNHAGGSGCSTGKKCLEIGAINLRGVVHAENGFIAVVSNGLNKAYFLRENDPVFNGYVVKITGDSIVFQETLQDRLGKSFTREVVKKITTPAV